MDDGALAQHTSQTVMSGDQEGVMRHCITQPIAEPAQADEFDHEGEIDGDLDTEHPQEHAQHELEQGASCLQENDAEMPRQLQWEKVDVSDRACPMPIKKSTQAMRRRQIGEFDGFESYASSVPRPSFQDSISHQMSPVSTFASRPKRHFSMASPRSYLTAQSSITSYATAPSVPQPSSRWHALHDSSESRPSTRASKGGIARSSLVEAADGTLNSLYERFTSLVDVVTSCILAESATLYVDSEDLWKGVEESLWPYRSEPNETVTFPEGADGISPSSSKEADQIFSGKVSVEVSRDISKTTLHAVAQDHSENLDALMSSLSKYRRDPSQYDSRTLRTRISSYIHQYLEGSSIQTRKASDPVFSSEWLRHLHSRGILVDPKDELDWSGRGQHVEYKSGEETSIPLQVKRVLGYSASAIVESVQCRRILLARKTVKCNRRLTREDVITEVENLQRLQHAHVVRVVGTYTLRKSLSILLYPAADQNLEELMDELVESGLSIESGYIILPAFFGCLSAAMSFIHGNNVKHMDIKPKNILVRCTSQGRKIYIADFGIAKAYRSAAESFTDGPTSFTRTYAAPEVVMQDTRSYTADIFSLGCVFMEMFASMISTKEVDERADLARVRGTEFHAHITEVVFWFEFRLQNSYLSMTLGLFNWFKGGMLRTMLNHSPAERPRADILQRATADLSCHLCHAGPEPFEAAEMVTK